MSGFKGEGWSLCPEFMCACVHVAGVHIARVRGEKGLKSEGSDK